MKRALLFLAAIAALALATRTAGVRNLLQLIETPAFLNPPSLDFDGPELRANVAPGPLRVSVAGDATLERLDAHRVRLRSRSGHLSLPLAPGEAIYGLTARIVRDRERSETDVQAVGGLDRRGEIVDLWVLPTMAVYAPFFVSSRGYGVMIEGASPGRLDIGATESDVLRAKWHVGASGFSAVFFEGPSYVELLDRYTAHTGRPILPPRWVFSPWKWRNEHRAGRTAMLDGIEINADVAEDILEYERHGFPEGV